MAVPIGVSNFGKARLKNVWKFCHNPWFNKFKSLKDDIFSGNGYIGMNVTFRFLMSLTVTILVAIITANILYILNPVNIFTKQDKFLVRELEVCSKTETSVTLKWTIPLLPATRYQVQILSKRSDQVKDVDAWMNTDIKIKKLTPGVRYSFSVISFVAEDDGKEIQLSSEIISAVTKPSPPGPIDMHNSHVFKGHVELSWDASSGHLDSYSVVLKNCLGNKVAEKTTASTHVTLPLSNPTTYTDYVVEICALSGGERSDPQTEVMEMEESDLRTQDLDVTTWGSESATLEWTHPVNTPVQNYMYEVRWSLVNSDRFGVITVDPGRTWFTVEDLMPGQLYKFSMTSVLSALCGVEKRVDTQDISVTTRPVVPGMVDRMRSTIKSTSLHLKWKASEGMVDAYIVKIADDSSFRAEYKTDKPSLLIENLEVNTLYQVDIYAVLGNMMSEPRTDLLKTKDIQVLWGCMTKAILTGGVAVAGITSFAPILGAFGFGAAGIGKGTLAAGWMAKYGGTVASGSLFSTLQSLGVVGLGATAKAAIIASGMALGCIIEVA